MFDFITDNIKIATTKEQLDKFKKDDEHDKWIYIKGSKVVKILVVVFLVCYILGYTLGY